MKLYHYVHCPFCVRLRMVLGFLEISYESIILPYDDEETPIRLMNKKMLPIMEIDGKLYNESLEMIQILDKNNKLSSAASIQNYAQLEPVLNKLGSDVHSLAMPYWMWTPEFDSNSRSYFQTKKEQKRGPFKDLVSKKEEFINSLNENLTNLDIELKGNTINLNDILLASHIWGMYIVPEFQFEAKLHTYLQLIAKKCHFDYHGDYWR